MRALGLTPRTKSEADGHKFPFVAFAAPPSGSEDYAAEVCASFLRCVVPDTWYAGTVSPLAESSIDIGQAGWPSRNVLGSKRHPFLLQIRAAAELWDGTGTLLFTGSAGIFTVDDGSQCNEDSPVAPLGVSERNDR